MHVLMASRLTDGRVVFLTDSHEWTDSIDAGALAASPEAGEALLAAAARSVSASEVVDPYLVAVTERDGRRRPAVLREAIRAFGPSVALSENREESS